MMSRRMLLGSAAIAVTPGKTSRKRAKRMVAGWGTELVPGNRAAQIVTAGDGPVLWFNSDAANTVYLGDNSGITAVQQTVTPLPPLSWVAIDGKADVWAICPPGQSAILYAYPGGMNFFQLVEIIVKTILISASAGNGLFVYSGAPGLGDLVTSIVGPGTADDPFGNPLFGGFTDYSGVGNARQVVNINGGTINMGFIVAGVQESLSAISETFPAIYVFDSGTLSPTDTSANLTLVSEENNTGGPALVQLAASDLDISTPGNGMRIATGGLGPRLGSASLAGGTVVVANKSVTAQSHIFLSSSSHGVNSGAIAVSARNPGVSFTVMSTNGADGNSFVYEIVEPS